MPTRRDPGKYELQMKPDNNRGIAWWRIIGLCIALTMMATSVSWWVDAQSYKRKLDAARHEQLAQLEVDLSTPGIYEGPVAQSQGMAHGTVMLLVMSGAPADSESQLADFSARWQVVRDDQSVSDAQGVFFTSPGGYTRDQPGAIGAMRMGSNSKGMLRITVEKPIESFAGVSQTICVRNEFCGLEQMGLTLLYGVALIAGLIALAFGGPVGVGLKKYGWRKAPRAEVVEATLNSSAAAAQAMPHQTNGDEREA